MKNNPALPGGSLKSKPTWPNAFGCSATSAFFVLATRDVREPRGEEPLAGTVPVGQGQTPLIRKGIEMKRFLAFVLIAALGVVTIGCGSEKGTTKNKTETKTTQTKDGKTTGETTTSTTDTTKTTPPVTPGGVTTEKTTEKTTETTK